MKFKNEYQENLFKGLTGLVKNYPEFHDKDQKVEGGVFKTFNYTLAGYEQFRNNEYAKDCRGAMFFVPDNENQEVSLVALPMKKFFSIGEGMPNEVKARNAKDIKEAFVKEDGSLITSYVSPIDGELHFKSKGNADYVNMAALEKALNEDLKKELKEIYIVNDICVDMEFTSPENRVIKEYKDYNVSILKARTLKNGENIDIRAEEFMKKFPAIAEKLVKKVEIKDIDLKRKDIEGFVVVMNNGEMFKLKTLPYLSMVSAINFQSKDKLPSNLYSAAVNEMMDEVRTLLHYKNRSETFPIDKLLLQADLIEAYAQKTYIPMKKEILAFVENNKDLSDNEFTEKAKKECSKYMAPVMTLRKGGKFDLEGFAVKIFGNGAKAEYAKAEQLDTQEKNVEQRRRYKI